MNGNFLFPIIIMAIVVLFVTIARLNRIKKANYDERQVLARNAAYKGAFFFLLIYCFVCGLLHIFNIKWAGTAIQMFLGITVSFALFIALCILKDAYFSNSPKRNLHSVIFFFSFGSLNIWYFLSGFSNGKVLWQDSELSILVLYLAAAICFFVLGIFSIIKIILEKRVVEK